MMDFLFSRFSWYRRFIGGHWEKWYLDVVHTERWFHVDFCRAHGRERPDPLCRGTPECEDWPTIPYMDL